MAGSIVRAERHLEFGAKLVHHGSRLPEVADYLASRKNMLDANKAARAAQGDVVRLLQQFLGFNWVAPVAETLLSWKQEVDEVVLGPQEPRPISILLYGSTGEGKSALVSALLDMPGIAPSDCAGSAVTSCTMIYKYRHHHESAAPKPQSENPQGWAQWLVQVSEGAPTASESPWCKYGATLHFLKPSAFQEQRRQLVETIADYWLSERKERTNTKQNSLRATNTKHTLQPRHCTSGTAITCSLGRVGGTKGSCFSILNGKIQRFQAFKSCLGTVVVTRSEVKTAQQSMTSRKMTPWRSVMSSGNGLQCPRLRRWPLF